MRTAAVGRFYLCARLACRAQVLVCPGCDRGQIYCCRACSDIARRITLLEAGRRYQHGGPGRQRHAQRMARYRERKRKVTHQRSPAPPCDVLLISVPAIASAAVAPANARPAMAWYCSICGCRCADLVRISFLDGRAVRNATGRRDVRRR